MSERSGNRMHEEDWMAGVFVLGILPCVGFIIWAVVAEDQDEKDCHHRGGHMVASGSPYYVLSGKVLIPVQDEECDR